ncbi:MAG: hypothetical protein JSW52_01085 [Candidatus Coatesbacteria bacterium]|nr:MAG: hypothetical protein JSW52_01085 [Candidatus Coatesbacteria bacterium]
MWELIKKIIEAMVQWVVQCIPKYEPDKWNDFSTAGYEGVQDNNNCYNYACDTITGTFAQPGEASGIILTYDDLECEFVTNAAIADGLVSVDCDEGCGCKECQHKVALVMDTIDPKDYHWYRQDRDGTWSHKPGDGEATNLDGSDNIITDPRTADWGRYNVFCGCFCVNKTKITIE